MTSKYYSPDAYVILEPCINEKCKGIHASLEVLNQPDGQLEAFAYICGSCGTAWLERC